MLKGNIMNKFIILNLVWVFVAVGAFYVGKNNESKGSEAEISDSEGVNFSNRNRSSQVRSS